jgi:SlyX protein
MNEASADERFVRLEIKAAYLEKLASDLNEVVIAQGQLIDELRVRLDRVERQVRAGDDEGAIPHERPPHY